MIQNPRRLKLLVNNYFDIDNAKQKKRARQLKKELKEINKRLKNPETNQEVDINGKEIRIL